MNPLIKKAFLTFLGAGIIIGIMTIAFDSSTGREIDISGTILKSVFSAAAIAIINLYGDKRLKKK